MFPLRFSLRALSAHYLGIDNHRKNGVKTQTYVVFAFSTGPCVINIHNQSQTKKSYLHNELLLPSRVKRLGEGGFANLSLFVKVRHETIPSRGHI